MQDLDNIGMAEIIIAKQRSGPTGSIQAVWNAEYTRYEEAELTRTEEAF